MTPDGLLEVTDLKQYTYCPRIPFYRYCLPRIRPLTYGMREGIQQHQEEPLREERRSLRAYGLADGERVFDVALRSETLGLVGRLDMAIRTPATPTEPAQAIVVDYKLTRGAVGIHFQVQLAAYALLLEEAWQVPVRRAFLYHLPQRQAEEIAITAALRRRVPQAIAAIHPIVQEERMPAPPNSKARCVTCEFRRFCNDAV
ncbi:MAG: CRISPR-associated protein Cas4 [Ktedonobacterales bacterium]